MTASISLGPGVELREGEHLLVDNVRGQSVPLNESATFMLYRLREQSLDECAVELSTQFGVSQQQVSDDLEALCRRLNSRALVNFVGYRIRHYRQWLQLVKRLLLRGVIPRGFPALVRRRAVDTSSYLAAALSTIRGGLPTAIFSTVILSLALMGSVAFASGRPPDSFQIGLAWVVGGSLGLSMLLHEVGHTITLRTVPTVLITSGYRIMVMHRPVEGRWAAAVSAGGPVFAGLLGYALLGIGLLFNAVVVVPLAISLVVQTLGLTVVAEDGRHFLGFRPATARWLQE